MTPVVELKKNLSVRPKRFRVEDFRKMTEAGILPEESGWEVIDGYLVDKMTIGSRHASIVNRLNNLLSVLVAKWAIVSVQNPVQIDDYNEPEPDIALLHPRSDFYSKRLPTPADVFVLVEVADSTIAYDRDVKIALYAEAGIVEVWLVNLKEESIEQYSSPQNGRFGSVETFRKGQSVQSISLKELSLNVDDVLGL